MNRANLSRILPKTGESIESAASSLPEIAASRTISFSTMWGQSLSRTPSVCNRLQTSLASPTDSNNPTTINDVMWLSCCRPVPTGRYAQGSNPLRQPDREARAGLDRGGKQVIAGRLGRLVGKRDLAMSEFVGARRDDRLGELGI